jgi:hypothetical protein
VKKAQSSSKGETENPNIFFVSQMLKKNKRD